MSYGYTPPEEREDEESDFVRLSRELADVDVGPQEGDASPAVDVVSPPPSAPKSVDALKRAQAAAKHASKRAQLGRAGSDFIAAFGGYKADDSFWDSAEKMGAQGVSDVEKLRGVERQEGLDADTKRLTEARIANYLKPAKEAKGKEPATLGDRTVIEKFLGLEPGALAGTSDKTLERITGLQIADLNRKAAQAGRDDQQGFQSEQNRLSREAQIEAAKIAAGAKAEEKLNNDVTNLGKDLEGTAGLQKSFASVDSALATAGKDVPGIGPWDSIKPDIFDSSKDTIVKQGLKQIIAVVLKKQSGSTVSEDEYNRTLSSYGISRNATRESFGAGYEALKRAAVAAAKETEARYKPEVAKRYHERGGVVSEDFTGPKRVPLPPGELGGGTSKGHGKVVKETKTIRQYEDGYLEEKT